MMMMMVGHGPKKYCFSAPQPHVFKVFKNLNTDCLENVFIQAWALLSQTKRDNISIKKN